jgi:hypothetical protein
MALAVEKRMKRCGVGGAEIAPGVTATWARRISSKAKSQLSLTPSFSQADAQSAQA